MSIVHLKNKRTGVTYVYECHSFWDKERKRPSSKRVCIGKLNPENNEFIPSKRIQLAKLSPTPPEAPIATIRTIGATLLLDHICEKLELSSILKTSFPEHWRLILSLAYFQVMEGRPLSRAEHW